MSVCLFVLPQMLKYPTIYNSLLSQGFPTQNGSIIDIKEGTNLDLVTTGSCNYFSLGTNNRILVLQEESLLLLRLNAPGGWATGCRGSELILQ